MASRGNSGTRNKSHRGRGASHSPGKSIHKSSGNLSHQTSSDVKNQQKKSLPGRGGQNFRGRGEFHRHSKDDYENKIHDASSDLNTRFQQQQSTPSDGGHAYRGRGGLFNQNQNKEHHNSRNPDLGNVRNFQTQHSHPTGKKYIAKDQYMAKHHTSLGDVHHDNVGHRTKTNSDCFQKINVSSRGGFQQTRGSSVPSPNAQSKNNAPQFTAAANFIFSTPGGNHTNPVNISHRKNVPFKKANQHLTNRNLGQTQSSQNLTTATGPQIKNTNTASTSTPHTIIKHKLKKPPNSQKSQPKDSTPKTRASGGNEKNVKPQSKNLSKRNRWRRHRIPSQHVQQSSEPSLLTFSRVLPEPEHYGIYDEADSDASDSISTVSHGSSENSDGKTLQDFGISGESDSSSDDDISVSSGIGVSGKSENMSDAESFVAVYWDIENCPVPSKKSAIDVVKKIRDTFYENRTEAEFFVACDVRNLTKDVAKDLSEAFVTVVFADSSNKNAADSKLMLRMNLFQCKYQKTNSAVVLISGDSDFSNVLEAMRYYHRFYVNVLCNKSSKQTLQQAAHYCMLYDDFVKDLPDRKGENSTEFCMTVSGFPENMKGKSIKHHIENAIKSVNGKVRNVSGSTAELVFSNMGACERAQLLLERIVISGSSISLTCYTRNYDSTQSDSGRINSFKGTAEAPRNNQTFPASSMFTQDKHSDQGAQTKEKKKSKSSKNSTESSASDAKNKLPSETELINLKEVNSKSAALKVSVQYKTNDVDFWKKELMNLLKTTDISLHTDSNFDGFFLISFSSIGKAQKAQKKILKAQETNPLAPKFIKLIKDDITSTHIKDIISTHMKSLEQNKLDSSTEKIEETKNVMNTKRKHCLQKFEEKLRELNEQCSGKSAEECEIVKHKMEELKQQKIVFLQYNNHILQKLANFGQQPKLNMEQICEDHLKDYSRECASFTEGLPIYARRDDIVRTVKKNQVVLIRAETGSGKSTQIIQYLWRNGFGEKGVLVCTQPRKLAAISIAKHVSNQIGSSLGGIVGYQVGLSNKKSDKTQILFMTDYTMLKMCVNSELFENVSCVIIDEAHERSIYTDLLLGMIKSALPKRRDLRVIITSATIDTSVFCSYFSLPLDAVMQISGRTFPIEDIWLGNDVSVGWNYLEKSVSVALDLLKEDPGDILVFLTTPLETEQASTLIKERLGSNKKVIVHHLHGKLDVAEQQKVFVSVPKGSRKIVFSTNCAETSITIPGIRYVIDCGMVKEAKYDAVRNLNVLSVGLVSQSSAEQRRGRAGRTQSGKCYRLYSKSNYDNEMAANTEPEILRVNLGQALLKLMELGVQDPTYFDFVESPSRDSLMTSMKQLIHLGAVDRMDRKLTDLGLKMAKLPLEPRLSHLIFRGIDQNIAYESVVVAALATVSRNIFFRNEGNKKEADAKKVRFCQSESDFLTYFEIFKEWISTPKGERSQWCVLNCINAKSMRVALELVTELLETVRRELSIQISSKFTEDLNYVDVIHSIIFYSFSENLCVFSGFYKFGYRSPALPGEFHVHPSSSLCYLGQWKPQYIVYDTILKTSQAYLLNVTPVSKEAVEYAIECGWLPYSLNSLENLSFQPYQIGPVGETILKKSVLGKNGCKRIALEQQLHKLIDNNPCAIEVKFNKGDIIVHLASRYHQYVEEIMFPVITEAQQELQDEQSIRAISDLPELGFIFGCGVEIKEIILPGEFRTVDVKINSDISLDSVLEKLGKFGGIYLVKEYPANSKVTFSHVASAMEAFKKLKNPDFTLRPQLKHHEMHKGEKFFKVFISILRRPCTGLAFVSFKSPGDFPEASGLLCGTYLLYDDSYPLQVGVSRNQDELMIKKLPGNATKEKLVNLLKLYLPSYIEIKDVKILRIKEFESRKTEIAEIKEEITSMITNYTPPNNVTIEFKNAKPKDFTWNAWAYFHNPRDGQIAVNAVNGRSVIFNGQRQLLEMKPQLRNTLFCDSEVFVAVKEQIDEALKFYTKGNSKSDLLNISAKKDERKNGVTITITSNNLRDITDARNCIMNILMGDKICCEGNQHLEKLFLQQGKSFLKGLEVKMKNFCVKLNAKSKVITLFGSEGLCSTAKNEINQYLGTLSMENSVDIHLISDDFPKGLMRELVKKYGYNLDGLRTHCSLQSVEINTSRHILTMTGDTPSINKVKDVLKEISKILYKNVHFGDDDEDAEICPICFVPVDAKFHRLEYCGHACCKECILLLFRSQDIPLECPSEDCRMSMVVEDINWAVKEDKELSDLLCRKALQHFVDNSNGSVHYCPTPDCPMVYRANHGDDYKFCCPSCQNDICTKCHAVYHYGMTCELYKCCQKDDDYSLKVYLAADHNNRKLCPKCKAPIEKNGGCNHMTCWKCNCHMCWLCEKVFSTGEEVYSHQPYCARTREEPLIVF